MSKLIEEAIAFRKQIDNVALSVGDQTAVKNKDLYPEWNPNGHAYKMGDRFRNGGLLYKVKQAHTSQADWIPGQRTESLYEVIDVEHAGTIEDPIPYHVNMEVFKDKYYTEDGIKYKCTRDSGIALQHKASALVGHYFEAVIE